MDVRYLICLNIGGRIFIRVKVNIYNIQFYSQFARPSCCRDSTIEVPYAALYATKLTGPFVVCVKFLTCKIHYRHWHTLSQH
jgi:hypothetical protein